MAMRRVEDIVGFDKVYCDGCGDAHQFQNDEGQSCNLTTRQRDVIDAKITSLILIPKIQISYATYSYE